MRISFLLWPTAIAAGIFVLFAGAAVFVMLVALYSKDSERRRRAAAFFKDLLGLFRRGPR